MTGFVPLAWLRAPARIFFLTGGMACAWGDQGKSLFGTRFCIYDI